jgi:type IV pilus assembly protein PilE
MGQQLRLSQGFTLVECAVVCAMVGILASIALPSYRDQQLRAQRLDAVEALSRLQNAQEQYRSQHGSYASDWQALRGVSATSSQGHYRLVLASHGPESYRATAQATGPQTQDKACLAISLDMKLGFATTGPSPACWNR